MIEVARRTSCIYGFFTTGSAAPMKSRGQHRGNGWADVKRYRKPKPWTPEELVVLAAMRSERQR